MQLIDFYIIFLLEIFFKLSNGNLPNQTSPWSCHLTSEHRLECRNLFNFYLTSYSLCRNDQRLLTQQNIDELYLVNDYNCLDHSFHCYFEFDSSWSLCLNSLRKLTIENLSFIVRLFDSRKLLPINYLKITNTHGSITELLHLFHFSNQSSIYIQNRHPRWSGMDLYAFYLQNPSINLKQFWINVFDWYPLVYLRSEQQLQLRQWLLKIPCLHIELGDCRAYHYDLIFLRDLFALRHEIANELYCYENHASQRYHWSKVPNLYVNYILPRRPPFYTTNQIELHENCFEQFTKSRYSINSYTDLEEFYSYFDTYETNSIQLWTVYPYATIPNLMQTTTIPTYRGNRSIGIDFINIYEHAAAFNETRWLSSIEAYPDGRFLLIDNRNQHILLLNENGTYRIDLTAIFFRQIQLNNHDLIPIPTIHSTYSFSQIHIDQDSYVYLIPTLPYYIYIFSKENRLVRCLTPTYLRISIIRSDCLAITYTGLIYICDDTYRVIRIYTRMGIPQKNIRLDYLPLKLFISNNRIFTYSIERIATIQMYTLSGQFLRTLTMCSYNLPSEIIWFRGRYFLTCGTYLYVLNESGDLVAEQSLHTLIDYSQALVTIHDFALNKNGVLLLTFRQNGTLFNRYWIIRPTIV